MARGIDGKVKIQVVSNAGEVSKQFNKLDKSLIETKDSASKAERKFSTLNSVMKAGIVATVALATKKIFSMGDALVNVSSDFEETNNKFTVVFKDVQKEAQKTAKVLSESYGLSNRAAKQLLSDTGDLLSGFGFQADLALELSDNVNKLAVDLASFTNYAGGAEGASQALTKALLGERESVKQLGIAILEEDVKAKVKAMEATGELTNETMRQKKAIATLQIAYEQSKNSIGDYARSTGTFAQNQRELNAEWENTKTILGNDLLPIWNQFTGELTGSIEKGGMLRLVLEGLVEGLIVLGNVANQVIAVFKNMGIAVGSVFSAIKDFSLDPITDGFKQMESVSMDAFKGLQNSIKDFVTADSLEEPGKIMGKSIAKGMKQGIVEGMESEGTVAAIEKKLKDLDGQIRQALLSGDDAGAASLVEQYLLNEESLENIDNRFDQLIKNAGAAGVNIKAELESAGKGIGDSIVDSMRRGEDAFESFRSFATSALQNIASKFLESGLLEASSGGGFLGTVAGFFSGKSQGGVIDAPKGFASGGIIPQGDDQLIGAKTGEMVLTKSQQSRLFNIADGNGTSASGSSSPTINIYPPKGFEAETQKRPNNETEIFFKRVGSFLNSPESDESLSNADFRKSNIGVQAS